MRIKNISRRNILKTTIVSFLLVPFTSRAALSHEVETESNLVMDSDYLIINGWVLLKSDVMLES